MRNTINLCFKSRSGACRRKPLTRIEIVGPCLDYPLLPYVAKHDRIYLHNVEAWFGRPHIPREILPRIQHPFWICDSDAHTAMGFLKELPLHSQAHVNKQIAFAAFGNV